MIRTWAATTGTVRIFRNQESTLNKFIPAILKIRWTTSRKKITSINSRHRKSEQFQLFKKLNDKCMPLTLPSKKDTCPEWRPQNGRLKRSRLPSSPQKHQKAPRQSWPSKPSLWERCGAANGLAIRTKANHAKPCAGRSGSCVTPTCAPPSRFPLLEGSPCLFQPAWEIPKKLTCSLISNNTCRKKGRSCF